jgi:hypothetical protein
MQGDVQGEVQIGKLLAQRGEVVQRAFQDDMPNHAQLVVSFREDEKLPWRHQAAFRRTPRGQDLHRQQLGLAIHPQWDQHIQQFLPQRCMRSS